MKEEHIVAQEIEFKEFSDICVDIHDSALLIIRIHLYTEYLLDRLIICYLPRGDRLVEGANLSYNNKLSIVNSFDYINDEIISSLKNLNKVRNKCSHELKKEITFSDIDLIGRPRGIKYTKVRKKCHDDKFECLRQTLAGLCGTFGAATHLLEHENILKEHEKKGK